MNCQDATRSILLHSSGELDEGRKAELTNHLDGCAACQAFAADLSSLGQLVRDAAPDASDALVDTVLSASKGRPSATGRIVWMHHDRRAMLAVAAGLVLCFGIWQAFRGISEKGMHLEDSRGARIATISDFMHFMTHADDGLEPDEVAESPWPAMDLEALAEQILATQGLDMDFTAELGEDVNQLEERLPTTLQWHNSPGLPSGRCG